MRPFLFPSRLRRNLDGSYGWNGIIPVQHHSSDQPSGRESAESVRDLIGHNQWPESTFKTVNCTSKAAVA